MSSRLPLSYRLTAFWDAVRPVRSSDGGATSSGRLSIVIVAGMVARYDSAEAFFADTRGHRSVDLLTLRREIAHSGRFFHAGLYRDILWNGPHDTLSTMAENPSLPPEGVTWVRDRAIEELAIRKRERSHYRQAALWALIRLLPGGRLAFTAPVVAELERGLVDGPSGTPSSEWRDIVSGLLEHPETPDALMGAVCRQMRTSSDFLMEYAPPFLAHPKGRPYWETFLAHRRMMSLDSDCRRVLGRALADHASRDQFPALWVLVYSQGPEEALTLLPGRSPEEIAALGLSEGELAPHLTSDCTETRLGAIFALGCLGGDR